MWHILWILLQVSVFFSVIIQGCTTDRKSRVHTYTIGLLRQAIVVSWGWLPSVMRADSYRHHCTVGLCQRLVCYNGELKARQEHQQGSRQQKSSQVLDGNSDQLRLVLVDSRAVEVTQSTLQKQLWPVGLWGLKIWEPTSRLLLPPPPPLCGCSFFSYMHTLSSGQWPLPRALNKPMLRALLLSPSAQPLVWPRGVHFQHVSTP